MEKPNKKNRFLEEELPDDYLDNLDDRPNYNPYSKKELEKFRQPDGKIYDIFDCVVDEERMERLAKEHDEYMNKMYELSKKLEAQEAKQKSEKK